MRYAYVPEVGWQQSALEWGEDASSEFCENTLQITLPRKLSKGARRRARKRAARARAAAQLRLAERREVRVEDAPTGKLRVIFCDFDGVLNQHRRGAYELSREHVERLDRLARETGAVLVVSSWWRNMGVARLRDDLASAGFHGRLIGRTPWLSDSDAWDAWERGTEIGAVLRYLGDRVESYVILDDHDRMGEHLHKLVQTDPANGLTEVEVEMARALLVP